MHRPAPDRCVTVSTAGEHSRAFVPAALPPQPPVQRSAALAVLGRLDAITALLPNASRLLYSFVRNEAVPSSQIEGTQSSLADLLLYEIDERPGNAAFVPPPAEAVPDCLAAFERFLNDEPEPTPPLIKAALCHVQFETIHPYLGGNGRIGRLLIVLQRVADGVLHEPMLYPSLFFKTHRAVYYERLDAVRRHGDWEGWLDSLPKASK